MLRKVRLIPGCLSASGHDDFVIEQHDVEEAYRLEANSYIVEPVEFGAFADTFAKVGTHWIMKNRGSEAPAVCSSRSELTKSCYAFDC